MSKSWKYLIVMTMMVQIARSCRSTPYRRENPKEQACLTGMLSIKQRMADCCPAPVPIPSFENSGKVKGLLKAFCGSYFDKFKQLRLLQDDNNVDVDKFEEFTEKFLTQNGKADWKEVFSESINTCAASDKNADMYYEYFELNKEECNMDSFLMSQCSTYVNYLNCIPSYKKDTPDCAKVDEFSKKCAKFLFDIDVDE